jgi:SAM-dependent methyltransferase
VYDEIAKLYHLIYSDWDSGIKRQSAQLERVVRSVWGYDIRNVLDVTCGIGTQSIGLAQQGFKVTASDVSSNSVKRATTEAKLRDVSIKFTVCNILNAAEHHGSGFDLVISCDNSIPHLLSDDEILSALRQMFECLRGGGGGLVTLRNYGDSERRKGNFLPYGLRTDEGKRYAVFQTRQFDGDHYDVSIYFVEESDPPIVYVGRSRYYAVSPERVMELMRDTGFVDVQRFDDVFYQPLLVGTRQV